MRNRSTSVAPTTIPTAHHTRSPSASRKSTCPAACPVTQTSNPGSVARTSRTTDTASGPPALSVST